MRLPQKNIMLTHSDPCVIKNVFNFEIWRHGKIQQKVFHSASSIFACGFFIIIFLLGPYLSAILSYPSSFVMRDLPPGLGAQTRPF